MGFLKVCRVCKGCGKEKESQAFLGARAYCRLCWLDLPEEVKREDDSYVKRRMAPRAPRGSSSTTRRR